MSRAKKKLLLLHQGTSQEKGRLHRHLHQLCQINNLLLFLGDLLYQSITILLQVTYQPVGLLTNSRPTAQLNQKQVRRQEKLISELKLLFMSSVLDSSLAFSKIKTLLNLSDDLLNHC
jgi:hypothetical protein